MGGKLKWRFDASTFKLLGRGLITDRITAIYELVKNCYDANSTKVELNFIDVDNKGSKSTIIIRDNGLGMSLRDITDKWLVVGTSSKRNKTVSDPPFNRRFIGEKGVGRFATDKLGGHLQIFTKRKNDPETLSVIINWSEYENQVTQDQVGNQPLLFTELENDYEYVDNNNLFDDGHGTQLEITLLHEAWDKEMLLRLENQLGRILPTLVDLNPPFEIFLEAETLEMSNRNYLYEDDFPSINWKITGDTATISGYACQSAKATFRGRVWVVYFTVDLPFSSGPWLLGGLPGLIVEAQDSKNEVHYKLNGFEKAMVNSSIRKPAQNEFKMVDFTQTDTIALPAERIVRNNKIKVVRSTKKDALRLKEAMARDLDSFKAIQLQAANGVIYDEEAFQALNLRPKINNPIDRNGKY